MTKFLNYREHQDQEIKAVLSLQQEHALFVKSVQTSWIAININHVVSCDLSVRVNLSSGEDLQQQF